MVGQMQHELAAGAGAPGLDETQMARRHGSFERDVKLVEPPPQPPLTEQRPNVRSRLESPHRLEISARPAA